MNFSVAHVTQTELFCYRCFKVLRRKSQIRRDRPFRSRRRGLTHSVALQSPPRSPRCFNFFVMLYVALQVLFGPVSLSICIFTPSLLQGGKRGFALGGRREWDSWSLPARRLPFPELNLRPAKGTSLHLPSSAPERIGSGWEFRSKRREGSPLSWERPAWTRKSPGRRPAPKARQESLSSCLPPRVPPWAQPFAWPRPWAPPAEWKGRRTARSTALRPRVASRLSWLAPVPGKFAAVCAAQSCSPAWFWTPQTAATKRRRSAAQRRFFFAAGFPPCSFAPFPRSPSRLTSAQRSATTRECRPSWRSSRWAAASWLWPR